MESFLKKNEKELAMTKNKELVKLKTKEKKLLKEILAIRDLIRKIEADIEANMKKETI